MKRVLYDKKTRKNQLAILIIAILLFENFINVRKIV